MWHPSCHSIHLLPSRCLHSLFCHVPALSRGVNAFLVRPLFHCCHSHPAKTERSHLGSPWHAPSEPHCADALVHLTQLWSRLSEPGSHCPVCLAANGAAPLRKLIRAVWDTTPQFGVQVVRQESQLAARPSLWRNRALLAANLAFFSPTARCAAVPVKLG